MKDVNAEFDKLKCNFKYFNSNGKTLMLNQKKIIRQAF